jgi:hypothetical protein
MFWVSFAFYGTVFNHWPSPISERHQLGKSGSRKIARNFILNTPNISRRVAPSLLAHRL